MILSEFYAYISSVLNVGTTLDTFIPEEVRKAARILEQTQNWSHMHVGDAFTLSGGLPHDLGALVKRMEYIWQVNDDGTYRFYNVVEVGDLPGLDEAGEEENFRRVGRFLYPNFEVLEDMTFNFTAFYYTEWPTPNAEAAILTIAESALFHLTMVNMSPIAKDPELATLHQPFVQAAIDLALAAEAELAVGARLERLGG